ncbi:histidine phosphatase family protein [Clostridium sp. P21]|uniref:Histidine phosphatase family protein n=1 Tax=Clostridium muellerianum TaxID=2716538 RepID=A0A7Y0ELU5_9CLOT|nr:histidine phosphatase family protein [Clostridium muellerianum]NMM65797.1 histidine phosphatase family protein [Clostridium muellerianum]
MKIYITRHGETEWNKEFRMQGWKNSNLTEEGIENAKKLGKYLKDLEFDLIYTSPLKRAVDTAKYIRGEKNTKIVINEDFKEMNFGLWEGMTANELINRYPKEYENFLQRPQLFKSFGGENFEEFVQRVKRGLYSIIENNNTCDNVLVVAHAVVIKAVSKIVKGYGIEDIWSLPYINGTSITILEVEGNNIRILVEGDTSHIS